MADPFGQVRRAATEVFAGQRVVIAGGMLAATGALIEQLRSVGVERMLVLPGSVGTGALPEGDDLEVALLDVGPADTATQLFREEERIFADPPAAIACDRSGGSRATRRSCSRRRSRRCRPSGRSRSTALAGRSGSRSKTRR